MDMIANWLGNSPDFAVPFALAALGLILTERAGVLALGAEGLMLVGALAAIGAQLSFGTPMISLILAMLAASVVSLLFALMVLVMRINQVIAGLALVFFCQGLTGLLGTLLEWTNHPVTGLSAVALWPLSELPLIGKVFVQNPLVYLTPLIFVAVVWFLYRSNAGLRLRAVGGKPTGGGCGGDFRARLSTGGDSGRCRADRSGRRLYFGPEHQNVDRRHDRRPGLDRRLPGDLRPLVTLACPGRGRVVRLYRSPDPATGLHRHPPAAILRADDALRRDLAGDDLGSHRHARIKPGLRQPARRIGGAVYQGGAAVIVVCSD